MRSKTWLLNSCLTAGFLVLTSATATSAQTGPSQLNCRNPQTQSDMNRCAAQDAKAADQRLNQVYRQVRMKYKGTTHDDHLVDAQLAWIKYRDANCLFSRDRFVGGSIAPLVYSNCITQITKQRTQELERFLKDGGF